MLLNAILTVSSKRELSIVSDQLSLASLISDVILGCVERFVKLLEGVLDGIASLSLDVLPVGITLDL